MSAVQILRLEGTATTDQTQTYTHLPFEVPVGTTRIDVRYEYSDAVGSDPHLTDGNTVDIGIFDVRGVAFMTDGFRGWSGSARSEFFIANYSATPGYLAGPIQPGTWQICLGLYKIAPKGCCYTVTVIMSGADPAHGSDVGLLTMGQQAMPPRDSNWYCGEMHCHTVHSDGDSTPAEVVTRAEALGLDFLAITDHNVLSHLAAMKDLHTRLLLIPGMEVTTYKGHWNVWGVPEWIDFRVEHSEHMALATATARKRGLLISLNHPRPYGPDWVYPEVDGFDCIEVWNGEWALFNDVALEFWEKRLRTGRRITAVGGSDCHFHHRDHIAKLARPTLWVQCEAPVTADAILNAIRAGHVAISESPNGPRITLSAGSAQMGDVVEAWEAVEITATIAKAGNLTLEWYTDAGCVARQTLADDTQSVQITVALPARYIRAQIVREGTVATIVCALTNPIYFN